MFSFPSKKLPASLWDSEILYLPKALAQAHKDFLEANDWFKHYAPHASGAIGGITIEEAQNHVINRFLNSAARMQYVCADPKDEQPDVRQMVFDQLGDGNIFLLDIGAGNGAGTLAILTFLCELRAHKAIPKLPLNVNILAVDYSPESLNYYAELQDKICPWLVEEGIHVSLDLEVCDLTVPGDFNEVMESFFENAKKGNIKRFLCVISAISGIGKDGLDLIHDSLKIAAAGLSHSKRSSSWLWVEPHLEKAWYTVFADTIKHTLQKVKFVLTKKGGEYNIKSDQPSLKNFGSREFQWHDPHKTLNTKSRVYVVSFKSNT